MEQLLKDKGYFKFIIGRSRVKGQFNRETIQRKYYEKEWVKQKIEIKQILEVIDEIEDMCHRFLINRIIFTLQIFCAVMAFTLFIVGIIVNVEVTKSDSSVKLYNFWDLSWPYFSCFFFIPLISLGLFFINKHYLNKYESIISQYFADININIFEKQQIIWKVGEHCSYIDLSQVSKLRSNSLELCATSTQSSQARKKIDIENKNLSIETDHQNNIQSSSNPIQINSNINYQKELHDGNPESLDNSAL
ncbi:hypothetical protein ABPG72_016193 [Tetrahymena utriculariae]